MLVAAGCSSVGLDDLLGEDSTVTQLGDVTYTAVIEGVPEDEGIDEVARGVLKTFTLQSRGVRSVSALQRRADEDIEELQRILRASGYYDARVTTDVSDTAPPQVTFRAEPGTRYTIGEFRIAFQKARDTLPKPALLDVAAELPSGSAAAGERIVTAEAKIVTYLQEHGFPHAAFHARTARANRELATLDVTATFASGPYITYGDVVVDGDPGVETDYLLGMINWDPNTPVAQSELNRVQERMASTGLFKSVSVRLPEHEKGSAVADGPQPITVKATEAKPRSISGSLRFDTDRGPGVRAGWRHRNLFGRAEDLRTELDLSLDEQKLSAELSRPRYPSARWTVFEGAELRNTFDDAFDEQAAEAQVGMRTGLENGWTVSGAIKGSVSATETDVESDTAYLIGLPLTARHVRTNDPLNATRGHKLFLSATPYMGLNDGSPTYFGVMSAGGSYYLPVIGEDSLVFATRARLASILSGDLEDVPVNQLFFAGGGSSVRGFGFRSISPVSLGDETGGRFLAETGLEARVKVTDSFGFVTFVDAGLVEEEPFPNFKERVNVGVGAGLRYYSPVGPIRFDLAFPLHRRAGDSLFEFYISLGQAF
ncbi:MAG: autotransporter assembly complex protein TamA [Minwuia sp.]|nr:autotransporter assembly complex protein TamA [Minwuia sp.]